MHTYFVNGVVQNKKDLSLLPKALVTLFDENNLLLAEIKVGEDASYSFPIELNKSYILKGNLELFNPSKVEFSSDNNGNINKNILTSKRTLNFGNSISLIPMIYPSLYR